MRAMVDLCEAGAAPVRSDAQAELEGIFLDLVKHAEREVRLRLAERLATAPWAPSGLINALALDDIEIARPVIAKSPILKDSDLIYVLTAATIEHQIEVAQRPAISEEVVEAIVEQGEPRVMVALAHNASAEIQDPAMARLVGFSRQIQSLRAPLARHPKLNRELACALYVWVGDALRDEIEGRFEVDGPALGAAVRQAVAETLSTPPRATPPDPFETVDQKEMEARLVAKLQAAGQLQSGFLMRALRQGKLHLFEVALASLAHIKTEAVRSAVDSDQPELLALACAGVGIDRSVFPTILSYVRALNETRPGEGPQSSARVAAAFALKGESAAIAGFKTGVAALLKAPT